MRTFVRSIVTAALLLSFCMAATSQQVAKTISYAAAPGGIIGFLQFTPPDYGTQKHPLIIFLHGIGERGNGTTQIQQVTANAIPKFCAAGATMRFTVNGQTSSFVVLSPQLSSTLGYWPTYYAKQMIAYAKANLQIDTNRIYVCGLSLGGGGIWRLITDTQNFDHTFDGTIAAAAPVCGTQEETDADFCTTIGTNHLPVWAFHSMDDGTVNVGATQHAQILANMCGNFSPAAKFTYYQSGGHVGAWVHAYDTGHITVPTVVNGVVTNFTATPNLYEWFLSNTRSKTTTTATNTAPVATAGIAQSIILPISVVTLTGTGTGTNGATIASYSWAKTSGPTAGIISLPLLNTTLVTGLVQGTYVFTLTVKDNHGLTSSSAVTITVNAAAAVAANKTPVANAGASQTVTLPTNTATLNGTASKDPDGTIAKYQWTQTAGPSGPVMTNRSAATTAVTGLLAGTYTFVLGVTDNGGLTAYSSTTLTVKPVASAPATVAANKTPVANAGASQTVTLPTNTATLNGTASKDSDGTIAKYQWTQTAGPGGPVMTNRSAATTAVTGLLAGTYTFVLGVTDNGGLAAYSSTTITVNPAATEAGTVATNKKPTANAGANQTVALPTNVITLNGSASKDADGTIASYRWTQTTGPAGAAMTNRSAATTTVTGLTAGVYTFVLGVTDNGGLVAYASTIITVETAATTTTSSGILGYIKISTGPYQGCGDASSTGRTAVYGTKIANGTILYTDAAKTKIFNGGWNWYSFTPTPGGSTTYAFAVYPTGGILLLRNCATGGSSRVAGEAETTTTTADEDIATLQRLKDSANAADALIAGKDIKLSMYPNPVHSTATITLTTTDNSNKTINVYNTSGVLKASYAWQTVAGFNTFALKDVSALANGLYIIDIRDTNGKQIGSLKFIKL